MPALPKNPATRRRTNVSSTRSVLTEPADVDIPALPSRLDIDGEEIPWEPQALEWWLDIWSSPMSSEFHRGSDIHGLYRIVDLVDAYWGGRGDRLKLAAEIRLAQRDYGLTPLDRRRLEWTIENTERAQAEGQKRRAAAPTAPTPEPDSGDPRLALVSG